MSADNTVLIKKSFSIENILSKPHVNRPKPSSCRLVQAIVCDSRLDGAGELGDTNKITPKLEPISDAPTDHYESDQYCLDEDAKLRSNCFNSPDPSGCDDEIVDDLSDITSEDARKYCQGKTGDHEFQT